MSCSFCCGTKRDSKMMTVENFEHIAKEVAPLGVHIYLHVLGEPLMHPNFEQILDIASKYNLPVNITTNGTLISEHSQLLLSHPAVRKVSISVHSLEGRDDSATNEYLTSITAFGIKCVSAGKPIVNYRMWSEDVNSEILEGDNKSLQYIIDEFGANTNADYVRGHMSIKLAAGAFICYDKQFEWPKTTSDIVSRYGKCLGGRDMLAILADGSVTPCCLDSDGVINLGNIFNQTIEEILLSERYQKLLLGFKGKAISEELCIRCKYRCRFDKNRSGK